MSLTTNLSNLVTRMATEFRALRVLISGTSTGDLSGLETNATNIVAAVNEVRTEVQGIAGSTVINDAVVGTDTTYSSMKIDADIMAAVATTVDAAPDSLNTLNELAAALGDDENFAASVTAQIATKANIADVPTNLDIGDVNTNFVTAFETSLAA